MLSVLFLTAVVGLTAAWDGNKENCPLPTGAVAYNPNPEEVVIVVDWTFEDKLLCYKDKPCHNDSGTDVNRTVLHTQDIDVILEAFPGSTDDPADAELTTSGSTVQPATLTDANRKDEQPVQLRPVVMQLGNVLRFSSSMFTLPSFTMMVHEVDEAGFLTCNMSRGIPVLTAEANDTFEVPHKFLEPGVHYFIASSEYSILAQCNSGFRLNVTVRVNNCYTDHSTACSGFGICITFPNEPHFHCHCCGNYRGETCNVFDACLSSPCKNGGLCTHPGNNSYEYACQCPLGYYGEYCMEMADDLCDVVNCSNNATCHGNSTHFSCDCPPGLAGTHCEVDINDCQPSPCHLGQCVDQRDGFKCVCPPGYYGNVCSEVHSKCELNPCKHDGYCQETKTATGEFNFTCHCTPGWGGIDCTEQVPVCSPNPCIHGRCVENPHSHGHFDCKCHPGFTGSRCEVNINDCDPNPCKFGGHCKDGIHTHHCLCLHSHAGSNCQFTLDLFSPILEEVDIAGGIIHNPSHTRNLYIVAGTLTAAVVIMILVLIGCYCRISQSYRSCCCISKFLWYKKFREDLVLNVDVTSASDCPLAVDSFWKHSDSETEALNTSTNRNAFQNHAV